MAICLKRQREKQRQKSHVMLHSFDNVVHVTVFLISTEHQGLTDNVSVVPVLFHGHARAKSSNVVHPKDEAELLTYLLKHFLPHKGNVLQIGGCNGKHRFFLFVFCFMS